MSLTLNTNSIVAILVKYVYYKNLKKEYIFISITFLKVTLLRYSFINVTRLLLPFKLERLNFRKQFVKYISIE
jgi:hypothetical protein